MGLLRRHSAAGGKLDDNGRPDDGVEEERYLMQRQDRDIVQWRTEMEHPYHPTVIHPGFRGLWQSQGRVLMLFVFSLAALVYYISLVWIALPLTEDLEIRDACD